MNDSRQYCFTYLIRSQEDFPEDFTGLPEQTLFPALFIPGESSNRFGWPGSLPCVLLTTAQSLEVHFHPESRRMPVLLTLDEYLSIQAGRLFLKGWLGFASKKLDLRLPYVRRTEEPVYVFFGMLRARLLRSGDTASLKQTLLGDELDLKFQNALNHELDKGERECARFFAAPCVRSRFHWLLRINRWKPGNLVVLTDRRVLWITENYRNARALHGSISCYASVGNIERIEAEADYSGSLLSVFLHNGKTWRIEIPGEIYADAVKFAAIVTAYSRRVEKFAEVRK